MLGIAKPPKSTSRRGSKRSTALIKPIAPTCTRSSYCSPRLLCRRARLLTRGMYCWMRRSRARWLPRSWYSRKSARTASRVEALALDLRVPLPLPPLPFEVAPFVVGGDRRGDGVTRGFDEGPCAGDSGGPDGASG